MNETKLIPERGVGLEALNTMNQQSKTQLIMQLQSDLSKANNLIRQMQVGQSEYEKEYGKMNMRFNIISKLIDDPNCTNVVEAAKEIETYCRESFDSKTFSK